MVMEGLQRIFSGKSNRSVYIISCVLIAALSFLVSYLIRNHMLDRVEAFFLISLPQLLFFVLMSARRSRDLGKSGWRGLLVFVPVFGLFIWIYLLVMPSVDGEGDETNINTAQQNSVR
jgi:uncharacterized membrane protein YhaH (DUF805 family)